MHTAARAIRSRLAAECNALQSDIVFRLSQRGVPYRDAEAEAAVEVSRFRRDREAELSRDLVPLDSPVHGKDPDPEIAARDDERKIYQLEYMRRIGDGLTEQTARMYADRAVSRRRADRATQEPQPRPSHAARDVVTDGMRKAAIVRFAMAGMDAEEAALAAEFEINQRLRQGANTATARLRLEQEGPADRSNYGISDARHFHGPRDLSERGREDRIARARTQAMHDALARGESVFRANEIADRVTRLMRTSDADVARLDRANDDDTVTRLAAMTRR